MRIIIFVPSNVHSLELAGLMDVFAEANARAAGAFYEVGVVAEEDRPIRCGSGLRVLPDSDYRMSLKDPDTLLVAGSVGIPSAPGRDMIDWLARTAPRTRRYGSVCTGAFLLGDAGLLGGRHVATHWQYAPLLAERFPDAKVDGDRVFVRDGAMVTSAGSSAAIDLGLSLVEEDLGRDVALYVARRLVVFLKRPGDQSQFSMHLAAQAVDRSRLYKVQQYILSHPDADLSVNALANVAAMSPRNFTRVFTQEVGISPSEYVDLTRIDVARFLLEGSRLPIDSIAAKSGFGSARAMRRAFLAHIGATPSDYRERFRTSGDGSRPTMSEIG
ncbi:Transcriptional regulator GlxA family, contains an amidase domain and an AraC-type DNA-binding HTH domain [Bosea sp. CRIB-10]|uniref:GlxA family transcriptional regulator n=1 Tax=Bosea sp. CRIB-10 TaxID=378404 RepID=UPI0008F33468|nr:helix-turn-helix domain-containing protein [Bosea sp. CRIB-10]SFC49473.1 Transcriptional regulator GlxA family, contains an amidase domain and an AraC-type DNA-binding HTH domain [Bosea sp. CRIB-10]